MHDLQGGKTDSNQSPCPVPNPESRVSRSKIVPITVPAETTPKRKTQMTKATYSKDASIAELPSASHLKAFAPNKTQLSTSANGGFKHRLARVSLSCPKVAAHRSDHRMHTKALCCLCRQATGIVKMDIHGASCKLINPRCLHLAQF
jgi:hypothetical protein